jgi:hypothetical protein
MYYDIVWCMAVAMQRSVNMFLRQRLRMQLCIVYVVRAEDF